MNFEGDYRSERETAEAKRRHLLRLNDPGLRELESKLRLAYVNKARAAQIAEKELQRAIQRAKDEDELKLERENLERELQLEEKRQIQKENVVKTEYKHALDLQIEEKNEVNRLKLEDFLREKQMIDKVVKKIKKEEEEKVYQRLIAKKVERELIDAFVETQKERAKREAEWCERQNKEILAYLAEREQLLKERELALKEKRRIKNESVIKLAEKIREKEKESQEKDDILRELYEGRKRDEAKIAEHFELENLLRQKLELRRSNEIAIEIRRKEIERRKKEEDEYKQLWIENMEKEAKIEQMNDQKRRMKQLQLRREAERHMEERRLSKIKAKEDEKELLKALIAEEEERNRIVDEERMRLLRENASNLAGFLPPGVLKESDLDYLPSEVRKSYFQRNNIHPDPLRKLEEFYKIDSN